MNTPVSSLLVGDRLVSRCHDGRLEAEYALFDRSEVLLSPGFREEGYMTTAGFARARLYEALVTADLAYEAFSAMRGRHMRPLARSNAVRGIVDQLGPYETFQGGRFLAERGRYSGVWLDLDALAAACPLRGAAILFQVLHLVLVLEEVPDDDPVRLLTSQNGGEGPAGSRTWRRIGLEEAQRLPWVLREMPAASRAHGTAHDEAEVREEILRDLHARRSAVATGQPRLATLAAAIARTGSTPPPEEGAPSTQRMSPRPSRGPESAVPPRPSPRSSSRPPAATVPVVPPAPRLPATDGASQRTGDLRMVAQSLGAMVERPPFSPDLAIGASRAWLAVGELGFARHFAKLVVDDPSAPDDVRIQALEILDTTPKTFKTGRPPAMESIQPAPVIVLSQPPPPPAEPAYAAPQAQPSTPPASSSPPPAPPQYVPPEPVPPQYAPSQYAPSQYAPSQYAPSQYAPSQYAPSQSVPAQPVVAEVVATAMVRYPVARAPQTALTVRVPSNPPPPLDEAPFEDRRVLDPRLVLLSEPDSQRSASFRLLRDTLLAKKAPRIIAVSSGSPNEGKTTCAINLALALAERPSTRVLLMDGNFFAPSLGEIFRIDAATRPDPDMDLPVLAPYRVARLMRGFHVAALVRDDGDPPPGFNSRWFEMVIAHLAGAGYDYLVIDAAALDGSPAVVQLLGVADGTLLTARSHITTARGLRRAAEQIPEGRALGVTLMDGDS